jgi:hypothetical protein
MLRRCDRRPRGPSLLLPVAMAAIALGALGACKGQQDDAEPELPTQWGPGGVFGDDNLLTYAFTMSPEDLAQLTATAVVEKFFVADLTVTGRAVGPVGLRFKGLGGSLASCFENGRQVCDKVSFKVKLDHVDKATNLDGLTRLNLNAAQDDPSQLRERMTARLFAEMELFAPRVSHAFVTINGQRKGLFAVVEEIDAAFTRDRWGDAGGRGNLYREAWPTEGDPEAYDLNLETNLGMKDNRRIAAFGQAMRTALAGEPLRSALDRFATIEYLMRFLALDQVIKNEGLTSFYCDATGACGNSNYYWYETATGAMVTETKFWLLPWEMGQALRLQTPFDVVPPWDKPPANCNLRIMIEDARVMPPGCDVVFSALRTAGRPAYVKALDRLLEVWKVDRFGEMLDGWAAQIQVGTRLDPVGPGDAAFRAGVQALKRDLQAFRERIVAVRDEQAVVPFSLAAPGFTDFEAVDALPFVLGVASESNARTGVVHHLNGNGALAGATDLRFDFEFADDLDAAGSVRHSQFALMRLPLPGATRLPDLTRIRLRARADAIRNVRIELDSGVQNDDAESPRYGWDVLLSPQTTDLTLDASKLSLATGAPSGGPSLEAVLNGVQALIIVPEPRGRNDGIYGAGKTDPGFVEIDDVSIEVQ